jgi:hypothetical protein
MVTVYGVVCMFHISSWSSWSHYWRVCMFHISSWSSWSHYWRVCMSTSQVDHHGHSVRCGVHVPHLKLIIMVTVWRVCMSTSQADPHGHNVRCGVYVPHLKLIIIWSRPLSLLRILASFVKCYVLFYKKGWQYFLFFMVQNHYIWLMILFYTTQMTREFVLHGTEDSQTKQLGRRTDRFGFGCKHGTSHKSITSLTTIQQYKIGPCPVQRRPTSRQQHPCVAHTHTHTHTHV